MNIIVCIKQTPDSNSVYIDPISGQVDYERFVQVLNPADACAIEAAVRLKEQFGGTVTAITLGPKEAREHCARPSPSVRTLRCGYGTHPQKHGGHSRSRRLCSAIRKATICSIWYCVVTPAVTGLAALSGLRWRRSGLAASHRRLAD